MKGNRILHHFKNKSFDEVYNNLYSGEELAFSLNFYNKLIEELIQNPETLILGQNFNLIMSYIGVNGLTVFPRFTEIYTQLLYDTSGVRKYNFDSIPSIINSCDLTDIAFGYDDDNEPEPPDIKEIVEKFEKKLPSKKWFNDTDQKLWEIFLKKRKIVQFIEPFLIDIQNDISEAFLTETDNSIFLKKRKVIYENYIRRINKLIAKFELFEINLDRIQSLEKLIKYFEILKSDNPTDIYLSLHNQTANEILINIDDQEKFVYCHELGIIDYFKTILKEKNLKFNDTAVYPLIVSITGISSGYVKKLMGYA
nr:hypothetical protein [Saprospiraceae bacterium]